MKRDYIDFQDRSSPIGYLVTFRCYGTWLHGDERGSFDRHHRVCFAPKAYKTLSSVPEERWPVPDSVVKAPWRTLMGAQV